MSNVFTSAESYRDYNLKNNINRDIVEERTLFYRASESGNEEILKYFHGRGSICDAQALLLAARRGNLRAVKYLCENGAEITAGAINWARNFGNDDIVNYLLKTVRDRGYCENNNANTEEQNPPNAQDCW
jgi:hypothetical protein